MKPSKKKLISIPPEIINESISVPPEIFKKPLMISGGIEAN